MLRFNLLRLRTTLGLKQSQIAEVLKVPQSSISAMENGKTQVSDAYIQTLQQVFNIENINQYYDEVDQTRVVIKNNRGVNNGYGNVNQKGGANDALILEKLASLEKDVASLKTEKEEVDLLRRQVLQFVAICAKTTSTSPPF